MRYTGFLILLIFSISFNLYGKVKNFNLVFDLDYTLISMIEDGKIIDAIKAADGNYYRIQPWAIEGIELAIREGADISFFSGGEHFRNVSVLKQIKLSDGRNLYDIAHNVFSYRDLDEVSKSGKFGERFKKDLEKKGFDLKRTIIIDDYENFVPEAQRRNMLWLGKTYHYFNSFREAKRAIREAKLDLKYIPDTREKWFFSKNKLKYVFELILDAMEYSQDGSHIIDYIQKNRHQYIPYNETPSEFLNKVYGQKNQLPNICFRQLKFYQY